MAHGCVLLSKSLGGEVHPLDPNYSLNPPSRDLLSSFQINKRPVHYHKPSFLIVVCVSAPALRATHVYCRFVLERMCPPSSDVPLVRVVATAFALPIPSITSTHALLRCLNISEREGNGFGWVSLVGYGRSTRFAGGIVDFDENRILLYVKKDTYQWAHRSIYHHHTPSNPLYMSIEAPGGLLCRGEGDGGGGWSCGSDETLHFFVKFSGGFNVLFG